MKNILLLTSSLNMGGAERVATFLASAWSECGYKVTLMPTYSKGGQGSFYRINKKVQLIYLRELSNNSSNYFNRIMALRDFIRTNNIDHVVSFITNVNIIAILGSLGLGKIVIVCERSDPFAIRLPVYWRVLRGLFYPLASAVLVQTSEVCSKLKVSFFCSYKSKVDFISNPLSSNFSQFCSIDRVLVKSDKLIAVGRLSKEKQFDHIIRAFHIARPKGWSLDIYGDGPERTYLESLIQRLGLEDSVVLRGVTENLLPVYGNASIFCMTSLYEGFPNALLEAMSQGCAILSYRTPSGPKEMLDDGRNGMLIEINDINSFAQGIVKLTNDLSMRKGLGSNAINKVVSSYMPKIVLNKWESLFEKVNK